jgi:hypothetical protein
MSVSKKLCTALLGLALAGAAASQAAAAHLIITDVETGNGALGNVTVDGYGQPWTTPILMTDSTGKVHIVFCDDLQHDVNVGGGQHLQYHTGEVTKDGFGNDLDVAVSNLMGQVANLGRHDYQQHNEAGAIAAQAVIWGLEYGKDVSSTDATIQSYITKYKGIKYTGGGYAWGLIADNGTQSQIMGGVPEPATWLTLLMGFGALGGVLRSRRRTEALAAARAG